MIAEIYGKLSNRGTNLKETLEDNLTGNFFGNLRYIQFSKGIKNILLQTIDQGDIDEYEQEEWSNRLEFWPYHKDGELDAVLELNRVTIGIEVKYNSGLSSDDDIFNIDNEVENSNNQLARESRIIKELAEEKGKKPILLFIAKDDSIKEIIKDVKQRSIIEKGVELVYISWEDIFLIVETIYKDSGLDYFEKIILDDIYKLLLKKGFNSFKNFNNIIDSRDINTEDYYRFNSNEESKDINFKIDLKITEGDYYEFK